MANGSQSVLNVSLPLPAPIPTSAIDGLSRTTYSAKEVEGGTDELRLFPGGAFVRAQPHPPLTSRCDAGYKTVQRTGGGIARIVGLPYCARYCDDPDNGELAGTFHPYYSVERESLRKMEETLEGTVPDLPKTLCMLGHELKKAGVTDRLLRGKVLDPGQIRPLVVLVSPSGKSTLLNSIARRSALSDAYIRDANERLKPDGIPRLVPNAGGAGGAPDASLFEQPAAPFSLEEFEAQLRSSTWYTETLDDIKNQATRRQKRTGDNAVVLGFSGPSIAIANSQAASSYVPTTLEKSPNGLFQMRCVRASSWGGNLLTSFLSAFRS